MDRLSTILRVSATAVGVPDSSCRRFSSHRRTTSMPTLLWDWDHRPPDIAGFATGQTCCSSTSLLGGSQTSSTECSIRAGVPPGRKSDPQWKRHADLNAPLFGPEKGGAVTARRASPRSLKTVTYVRRIRGLKSRCPQQVHCKSTICELVCDASGFAAGVGDSGGSINGATRVRAVSRSLRTSATAFSGSSNAGSRATTVRASSTR